MCSFVTIKLKLKRGTRKTNSSRFERNLTLTSHHEADNDHEGHPIKAYLTSLDSLRGGIGRGTKAHLFDLESTFPQIVEVVNTAHSAPLHAIGLQTLHCAHLKVRAPRSCLMGDEAAHEVSHGRAEGRSNMSSHV